MPLNILIADDELTQRTILADILKDAGFIVKTAENGELAIELYKKQSFDIVLTDLKMPKKDGFEVLNFMLEQVHPPQVIMMTAFGTIPSAVNAIKQGAYDYLTKPFQKEALLQCIKRAAEKVQLVNENKRLKSEIASQYHYQNIIGKSSTMRTLYGLIDKVANVDATVLIHGESGTGKELVARAIHYSGKRKKGPFIALNCGAIPETLIESELFGHEKGAFTGAQKRYDGKFEQANGGTIFLDEIATMRLDLQIRLLRVLQEKQVQKLGSNQAVNLNVRVIAASNENLLKKVHAGQFREDLYHRLNVFSIQVPALRERSGDVELLSHFFMKKFAEQYAKNILGVENEALKKLNGYPFPGNVRELENIIEKAVILSDEKMLSAQYIHLSGLEKVEKKGTLSASLKETEQQMIYNALRQFNGSIKKAATHLGISYKTMQYRMKKWGLDKNQFKS